MPGVGYPKAKMEVVLTKVCVCMYMCIYKCMYISLVPRPIRERRISTVSVHCTTSVTSWLVHVHIHCMHILNVQLKDYELFTSISYKAERHDSLNPARSSSC